MISSDLTRQEEYVIALILLKKYRLNLGLGNSSVTFRTKKGQSMHISVVIPAKNEAGAIGEVIQELKAHYPSAEILVVNDGSTDNTREIAENAGALVITHPISLGNGAAIKSGARAASGQILIFMDGDGQHRASQIDNLLAEIDKGYDLVVGARDSAAQATIGRSFANWVFNIFASYVTGQKVVDLTSGFRAARADRFKEFLYLLPNKFSYPTTSTMAFFRAGFSVKFVPVEVEERIGSSHIKPVKDGIRFLLIIFKIATLYSPLKIFFPIAASFGFLGIVYYFHTYFSDGRFTNMGVLLLSSSVLVFLIGLISEQITMLIYKD